MMAVGARAAALVEPHPLGSGYGPGAPVERFVQARGKVLLLGAPLDAVTALHHAEALADIPGKRWVRYEVPFRGPDGAALWFPVEELDSNGILDAFAGDGPDAVEAIASDYVALGRHAEARIGGALCRLLDAADLVAFGVEWLEARFAGPRWRGGVTPLAVIRSTEGPRSSWGEAVGMTHDPCDGGEMTDHPATLTGGCRCGEVRFRVAARDR